MLALPTQLSARPARNLHAAEEGMLSLASLFVVLGFLVLIGLLANAGLVTSRKFETQNAADAAAYSASVETARGMNAITAANHLIGELTALVVLIHTLAGDTLDGANAPSTPAGLQTELETSYSVASAIAADTDVPVLDEAYDEAKKDSAVDGAIYDARMRLKKVLSWALQAHGFVSLITQLQFIPLLGPIFQGAGDVLEGAAWTFEAKVYEECMVLNALEDLARALQPVKVAMRDVLIPGLYVYSTAMVYSTPIYANKAASAVGAPNAADCSVYPMFPTLPVHAEPTQLSDPAKSQLVRASTPWIQWWRQPWIDFGKQYLVLSRFAAAFETRSTNYTLPIIKKLKEKASVNLYVLNGMDANSSPKTFESWTYAAQSGQAEQMFSVVGMAYRSSPQVIGSRLFHQENPYGLVCYAQAMMYNANPQQRGSGDANWQTTAGWDTLNWAGPAPEYPGPLPADDGSTPTPTTPQPLIQLNWQAKLIPTTRLGEATLWQTGPMQRILGKTNPLLSLSRTH